MTKIRRIEFQPEHLRALKVDPVVLRLRGKVDITEWAISRKQIGVTASLATEKNGKPVKVVACGGFVSFWPGMAELWLAMDADGGKMPALSIAIRRQVNEWIDEYGLDRVQSTVDAGWPAGIRFLEWLGMKRETVLRKFGPNGIDQILYARVR